MPSIPENLLGQVTALARSGSYLSRVVALLADGKSFESITEPDNGEALAAADVVVRRFMQHLEIEG